jgi:hypothetical protein
LFAKQATKALLWAAILYLFTDFFFYRNVYEFMENMLLGLPSRSLNRVDARFLIEGLQRFSSNVDSIDVGREKSFILCGQPQWRSKGEKPRTYGKQVS